MGPKELIGDKRTPGANILLFSSVEDTKPHPKHSPGHVLLRQGNGVLCNHRLPRRRVCGNKDTLVVLQAEDSLFLEDVQFKRPLAVKKQQVLHVHVLSRDTYI